MQDTRHVAAIASAGQRLRDAAFHALELLELTGHPPNASDDLRIAISNYERVMKQAGIPCATSAAPAIASQQVPDRAALERAHRTLRTSMPLDEMLKQPALAKTLAIVAFRKQQNGRAHFDWRKAQANDLD